MQQHTNIVRIPVGIAHLQPSKVSALLIRAKVYEYISIVSINSTLNSAKSIALRIKQEYKGNSTELISSIQTTLAPHKVPEPAKAPSKRKTTTKSIVKQ